MAIDLKEDIKRGCKGKGKVKDWFGWVGGIAAKSEQRKGHERKKRIRSRKEYTNFRCFASLF